MSTVITVQNLGKKYTISHQQREEYSSLRDVITNGVRTFSKKIFSPFTSHSSPLSASEDFWALKDVSFEVKQGDRIGIIGRNGAGKSTLLKILSRITEPTTGSIRIKGRVASLLEVGTGFHPELTGRENIFLNGAILGMHREEIRRKFDEIVDFAEIEKFLDTPVKRYSSGMYVRLAFAVAAHLEPEILIVDEVLAVGDAQFQKKCLGKMEDVSAKEGRTVLFVSHNMNAIEQLCSKILLMEEGRSKKYGVEVRSTIKGYLFNQENELESAEWINKDDNLKNPWFDPIQLSIVDSHGKKPDSALSNDTDYYVYIKGEVKQADPSLQIGYAIYNEEGSLLYWSFQTDGNEEDWPNLKVGTCLLVSQIPKRFLNEGRYRIELLSALYFKQWLSEPGINAPSINVTIQGGLSDSPYWMIKRPGMLAPILKWQRK
ncbi:MAG: ABC transporter ATP-binding protein [Desulfuromonadaceae bacterium]